MHRTGRRSQLRQRTKSEWCLLYVSRFECTNVYCMCLDLNVPMFIGCVQT